MLRKRRFKLIFYVGFPPELFDLKADPEELHDLSREPAFDTIRAWSILKPLTGEPRTISCGRSSDTAVRRL
jgi:hypothetical protein